MERGSREPPVQRGQEAFALALLGPGEGVWGRLRLPLLRHHERDRRAIGVRVHLPNLAATNTLLKAICKAIQLTVRMIVYGSLR